MSTQQALIIPTPKADFVVGPRPIPTPGAGQVVVKVLAAGLNPMNWAQREMDFMIYAYPAVIGADIAGVVEAVGEGVEGFAKGDEIFAQSHGGGFQQYTTLLSALLIRKPKNVSFDDVASFPITYSTAAVGLFAPAPIGLGLNPTFSWEKPQQGQSALVIGAGASTGQFAVQLLKFAGFSRIVVYASKAHFEYLTTLGATECIDRHDVPLSSLASKIGSPVHVVYDATSTGALDAAYDCVADGGKVTTVRPEAQTTGERDWAKRGVAMVKCFGFVVGPDVWKPSGPAAAHFPAVEAHTTFGKVMIRELPGLIEKGAVVPNRIEVVPNGLAGIPEALQRMKEGKVGGVKLVAHPQESAV